MKHLPVLCVLLAVGSCPAAFLRTNDYGSFYRSLADELKMPFLRYQLAMTVMQQSAASTFRPYPHTEHLLTADGLGVPDRIFSNLEALKTPSGFGTRLYRLATLNFGLNVYQVVRMIEHDYPCQETPSGCWDLGDVGSNCC